MIMDATQTGDVAQQQSSAYALMKRGKRGAAVLIAVECCNVVTVADAQRKQDGINEIDPAASALIRCKLLDDMLDILLNPYDAIGEWNNLDWLRWLMAGGKTLDEFSNAVKEYDYGTCCGLVWTANYIAYRCRTCSISPCMSLCGECFKRGDHTGHDFNMFRSQAGGACDCGDTSVMKPNGFCHKHSTNNLDGNSSIKTSSFKQPPADLLRVAERILPRLLLRLVQYLRENSKIADSRSISAQHTAGTSAATPNQQNVLLTDLDPFLSMLHDLSGLGAAMRHIMTVSLTNEKIYQWACGYYSNSNHNENNSSQPQQSIYAIYTEKVHRYYTEAVQQYTSSKNRSRRHSNTSNICNSDAIVSYSNSEDDSDEFGQDDWMVVDGQNKSGRKNKLNHSSFLQEIVFWTVRYEFPQKIVCFLLNLLPDSFYKESLTEAFVMHYGCVARVLATSKDSDTLSNHIVHISVQLFSNEALATRMVNKLGLLRIMVSSLRRMMTKILISSTLHDPNKNRHRVVDCSKAVMKEHCYWPLVSDLNNVLSHRPIAVKFMCDDRLLDAWFSYLSMFQGMNVNIQEMTNHVEFEPNTYYAAFSAELEASAYPMWALLSHLTSAETWPLTSRVLRACLQRLRKWLADVGYNINQGGNLSSDDYINHTSAIPKVDDCHQFTFHLPLHRYLAVFMCQAIRAQGARVENIIPHTDNIADRDSLLLAIMTHPLRAQAAFYEIMQGAWVRNGLQIKGQAMTYVQSNFCISMVDADIYLLQLCLSEISNVNMFMSLILEKFKAYDWMRVVKHGGLPQIMDSNECNPTLSLESLLVFLATLIGIRTNLCSDEDYDYCQSQLEMVSLLCISDKTHSHLMELMPERCGNGVNTSSASNSASNINNTGTHSSQESASSSLRDFETVLQTVAEYKSPQFEASGNMQQGIYIPLPHVWEKLYDPVHVLLRAIHRRDFQLSMDRYTAHMRSIGLVQQNQNLWPPFKEPHKHHSAYKDPRRALLSKLFHSVVWHCLYRSILYRDVSEHTLSLLIYLLDQAWICYESSHKTNSQQVPMDTYSNKKLNVDDYLRSKRRRIKITATDVNSYTSSSDTNNDQNSSFLLLNHWYDHDDLIFNLCTTITQIELPPPYLKYYFGSDNSNEIKMTSAAGSTIANNLLDYFTSSSSNVSPSSSESSNTETGNTLSQTPNIVPSLAAIASNEIPVVSRASQSSSVTARPPFYSLNAAAAATSSTMDSALNHVKQTLQFLRPQQLTNDNTAAVSNNFEDEINGDSSLLDQVSSNQDHSIENNEDLAVSEIDDYKNPHSSFVTVNESIISLLLKLHSHLSGVSNSYQPPKVFNEFDRNSTNLENDNFQNKIPLCGDGSFYVGQLLDKIANGSKSCYECIIRTRMALWPESVVMRETATREDEERERQERKRRARDKQLQMMNEMAKAQRAFLESARLSGDLESSDSESQSQSTNVAITDMECDEPANIGDSSSTFTSCNEFTATPLSNDVHLMDEFSNSSSTTKDTAVRSTHQQKSTQTVDCVICNQTVAVQVEQQRADPVGLVILVQGSNILAHRRHIQPDSANSENNLKGSKELHQEIETCTTISNSTNINYNEDALLAENEQNYYDYWPALPPLQPMQNNQQKSTDVDNKSVVTTIIDDEDMTTYASHCDRRKCLLTQYFNSENLDHADLEIGALTITTSPTPIVGNVYVQTCGHHLHLRCWNSYITSLRGVQRYNPDRGEYSCPLCRQLANSLMPLIPANFNCRQEYKGSSLSENIGELTEIIKTQESEPKNPTLPSTSVFSSDEVQQIPDDDLDDDPWELDHDDSTAASLDQAIAVDSEHEAKTIQNGVDPLLKVVNKCVHDMIFKTIVTAALDTPAQRDQLVYKVKWDDVISVAWTNILIELVQRNNSLIEHFHPQSSFLNYDNNCYFHTNYSMTSADNSGTSSYYNILPKRNCIAQLLKVLGVSARSLIKNETNDNIVSDIWYKLIGIEQPESCNSDPPLLMRDPCSVLLQLVLLLPNLELELFDTLVQLTFNMQIFVAALKVATAWNQHSNPNKLRPSESTENIQTSSAKINSNKCASDTLLMDTTEENDFQSPLSSILHLQSPSPPLFSQAVALAKTTVFLSQNDENVNTRNNPMDDNDDDFLMDHDDSDTDQVNIPIMTLKDNEENLLMLESYGRQCTLPFLRFATLLKKYINGENIDRHHQIQSSHDNIKHLPQSVKINHTKDGLIENSSPCTPKRGLHHWSQNDHEFLILARYLNLLKIDEGSQVCEYYEKKNTQNYNNGENKKDLSCLLPSALEAVKWPQWSYSTADSNDNVVTSISRVWLASFRETLITKNSNSVILRENATAIVASALPDIDPNCNSTNTIITMAARLLLAVDCCKGSSIFNRSLLPTVIWRGPRLLRLPYAYDDLFQYYHGRTCYRCHGSPRETSICLFCGLLVCLKESCCKTNEIYEAIQHSLECGGSTGLFLVITSSAIVVVRGKRACLWGSVYLDAFGEEDRELKRGKPLFLSAERYRLLERQWLAHRFDNINKKWVWHRDSL